MITQPQHSRPKARATAATSTTDTPVAIPTTVGRIAEVKVWVDVLSYVAVNAVAAVTAPSTTNTGYIEANSQEVYQIHADDTHVHIATTTGAGNYRLTFYG
jgi:hypothetical protein